MKLASLKNGRDGLLLVVSSDLQRALPATGTLQQALDDMMRRRGYPGAPHNKSPKVMGVLAQPYAPGVIRPDDPVRPYWSLRNKLLAILWAGFIGTSQNRSKRVGTRTRMTARG